MGVNVFKKIMAAVIGVAALSACGPITNGTIHTTTARENTASSVAASDPGTLPTPDEFRIKVLITKEQCFGSAGCNIMYEIDPLYVGMHPLTHQQFRVFYRINGGDSPQTDSFTVSDGEHMHYDKRGSLSTTGDGTPEVSATVTSVAAEN